MKNLYHLNEDEITTGDDVLAKELLGIQTWYNQEDLKLKNLLAKKRNDALVKYQQRAKIQQQTQKAQAQTTGAKPQPNTIAANTGAVDTTGRPVNAQGNPPTVESYSDILRIKNINEETFNTENADPEEVQELKNYMDSENLSYVEDEDGDTLGINKNELDPEWADRLEDMGLEPSDKNIETDDILDYTDEEDEDEEEHEEIEDENDEDVTDVHDDIKEDKVFYVEIKDADGDFTGKIYKLFDKGDWRAKVTDGESGTFEKLNYDPDWDEFDIVAFLRENYDEAELINKEEFNDHVEEPEEEVKESLHKIPTFEDYINNNEIL